MKYYQLITIIVQYSVFAVVRITITQLVMNYDEYFAKFIQRLLYSQYLLTLCASLKNSGYAVDGRF
jgi:hypothetical protein